MTTPTTPTDAAPTLDTSEQALDAMFDMFDPTAYSDTEAAPQANATLRDLAEQEAREAEAADEVAVVEPVTPVVVSGAVVAIPAGLNLPTPTGSGRERAGCPKDAPADAHAECPRCGIVADGAEGVYAAFGFRRMKRLTMKKGIVVSLKAQSNCRGCRAAHAKKVREAKKAKAILKAANKAEAAAGE